MIVLYILLSVLALVCLILLINIRVIIKYGNSSYLGISILGIRYKLAPKKTTAKKASSKKKKKKTVNKKQNKKSVLSEFTEDLEVSDFIELLKALLMRLYKHSLGHLKVKIKCLEITVGDDMPDKAAVTFGAVNTGVAWVLEFLNSYTKMHPLDNCNIFVRCDFDAKKTESNIEVDFKIRVLHLVLSALNFFFDFIKLKESKNISSTMKGTKRS